MRPKRRGMPDPELCTAEEFLQGIEETTGQSFPRPVDLAEGECLICRALGIDPSTPGVMQLPGMTLVTLPLEADVHGG